MAMIKLLPNLYKDNYAVATMHH